MLSTLATRAQLAIPYIYSTAITIICLFFMYEGKLDVSVGIGIIATMGLGSCIHKSNKTAIAQAIAVEPPCPQDTPDETTLIGVTK